MCSNRTIVGLKRNLVFHQPHSFIRSNRTIVGLKLRQASKPLQGCFGSNRTIVGLKQVVKGTTGGCPSCAAIAPLWD